MADNPPPVLDSAELEENIKQGYSRLETGVVDKIKRGFKSSKGSDGKPLMSPKLELEEIARVAKLVANVRQANAEKVSQLIGAELVVMIDQLTAEGLAEAGYCSGADGVKAYHQTWSEHCKNEVLGKIAFWAVWWVKEDTAKVGPPPVGTDLLKDQAWRQRMNDLPLTPAEDASSQVLLQRMKGRALGSGSIYDEVAKSAAEAGLPAPFAMSSLIEAAGPRPLVVLAGSYT